MGFRRVEEQPWKECPGSTEEEEGPDEDKEEEAGGVYKKREGKLQK